MDQTSWPVIETENEEPEQLELFPEPDVVVEYKSSSRVFTAVKPRATTGLLRDTSEGIHPFHFDFSGLEQRYYYSRATGKSSLDKWWNEYYDFSTLRVRTISSWDAHDFSVENSPPAKPKKNIQPGPKPSLNARKKW